MLVGVLWAAGTFLIFYRGYSRREDWALNLAGIAAAGVAFFPADFGRAAGEGRSLIGKLHFSSGLIFFLALAFVCLFCASDTLKHLKDEAKRIWFKRIYSGLGMAMVAVPAGVFALHYLLDRTGVNYAVLARRSGRPRRLLRLLAGQEQGDRAHRGAVKDGRGGKGMIVS